MESKKNQQCVAHCNQTQQMEKQLHILLGNYTLVKEQAQTLLGNFTALKNDFEKSQAGKFVNFQNVSLAALMEELLKPQNTNITFQIGFNSSLDSQIRYVRSPIDYHSAEKAAATVTPYIREDLAQVYELTPAVATQLDLVIQELDGAAGLVLAREVKHDWTAASHIAAMVSQENSITLKAENLVQISEPTVARRIRTVEIEDSDVHDKMTLELSHLMEMQESKNFNPEQQRLVQSQLKATVHSESIDELDDDSKKDFTQFLNAELFE